MLTLLFTLVLDDKPAPPLSAEQIMQIQSLVRTTESETKRIRARMAEAQKELAKHYAEFDLDVLAVEKLQAEVVELQKKQLASYHKLHVELRKIVGRERFAVLRQRIDNILNPPKKDK